MHSACYEFVLKGVVYGVTVNMDAEHPSVPSITTIFANADWHEREMMELLRRQCNQSIPIRAASSWTRSWTRACLAILCRFQS